MAIDFHDSRNRSTYASRTAEEQWIRMIREYVDIHGKQILDLGCGGGIYSKVLARAGAEQVIAMDFSAEMLKGAKAYCKDIENITFLQGNALETNLEDGTIDVLLERALIHHIPDLKACFREAHRILKTNGKFRTGRSILHELSDQELEDLVAFIEQKTGTAGPIKEQDRWTVWIAEKR